MLSQCSLKSQPFSEMAELKTSKEERKDKANKVNVSLGQIQVKVIQEISEQFLYLSVSLKLGENVIFKNAPWAGSNRPIKLGKTNNNNKIPSNLRIGVNMHTLIKIKNPDSHQLRKHTLESPDSRILSWQGIHLNLLSISIAKATDSPSPSSLLIRLLTTNRFQVCIPLHTMIIRPSKLTINNFLGIGLRVASQPLSTLEQHSEHHGTASSRIPLFKNDQG